MQLILSNPWGLLGLLGIPTVLLIHLLQRQSKPELCTTLFLLRHLQPESRAGRRIDRIRNSLPLWLQLLTVLVLTWLLVDPRWRRAESVQRVAVVLDSSLSMEAYRNGIVGRLKGQVAGLATAATATEWHVLESDSRRPALYSGRSLELSYPMVEEWHPRIGAHDLRPALGNARRLVGEQGVVIFVSDHEASLPPGVLLLNVGDAFGNGGFAGLRVIRIGGVPHWEALVRNYGDTPQTRTWWLESDGTQSAPSRIDLGPGAIQQLRGPFPKSISERVVLRLDPDRFIIDDALPIVKPKPKPIAIATGGAAGLRDFYSRLQASIPNPARGFSEPDIMVDHHRPNAVELPFCSILSLPPPTNPDGAMTGVIVAENHPLVEELNWQSLLLNKTTPIPPEKNDEVLVWQDDRPLAFIRPRTNGLEDLILNFDLESGNATKQPAVVLLMHRFIERRRDRLKRPEVLNVEQNQSLDPKVDKQPPTVTVKWEPADTSPEAPPAELTTVPLDQLSALRAPIRPGFFSITQGVDENQKQPLAGAIHFADTREANFNEAGGESDDLSKEIESRTERHSRPDPLAPVWLLMAGLLPAWCWVILGRPENDQGAS